MPVGPIPSLAGGGRKTSARGVLLRRPTMVHSRVTLVAAFIAILKPIERHDDGSLQRMVTYRVPCLLMTRRNLAPCIGTEQGVVTLT